MKPPKLQSKPKAYMQLTRRWGQRVQHFTNILHYRVLIITNQVWNLRKVLEIQTESSSEFNCSGNKVSSKRRYKMSWWSPYMTSLGIVIVGRSRIPFHRPTRSKVHGQIKLAIWSSNVSPENKVEPQARLNILILSKAYPTKGILSP